MHVLNQKLSGWVLKVIIFSAVIFSAHASDLANNRDLYLDEFEKYLSENILPFVPGAAILVVADGRVLLLQTYGVRETGLKDRITPDTIFRLASVSKGFASTATGLLVQKRALSWDTSIQSRLEDVLFKDTNYGKQITVRNLLSHTTGLIPHAYTNLVEENIPYRTIKTRLREVDFICAPGTCYSYQNVAFSLTGDLIQAVTGVTYEDFVNKNLFLPLGMKTASFGLQSFKTSGNHAIPHVQRNKVWKPVSVKQSYYNVAPAAGVNASISDMEKWLMAQLGHRPDVLSVETLNDLHTRVIKTSASQAHYRRTEKLGDVSYGLGWRIFDFGEYKDFIHHSGWVQGTLSEVVFNRDLQIGMVFLTNSETNRAGDLVFKFIELFEQRYQMQHADRTPEPDLVQK